MALSNDAISQRIRRFTNDVERGLTLYNTLVSNGYTAAPDSDTATPLRQPDRRDVAQFIFFEIAAKYEAFARDMFQFEVRIRLVDSLSRTEFIMGSVDRGLQGVMGWASPKQLSERAEHLFGKKGFLAKLRQHVGDTTYQRLSMAHKVRNHIAHSGTAAYRNALGSMGIPKSARKGCGPGRALIDYPVSASDDDRWFHRFCEAYTEFATTADRKLDVAG